MWKCTGILRVFRTNKFPADVRSLGLTTTTAAGVNIFRQNYFKYGDVRLWGKLNTSNYVPGANRDHVVDSRYD